VSSNQAPKPYSHACMALGPSKITNALTNGTTQSSLETLELDATVPRLLGYGKQQRNSQRRSPNPPDPNASKPPQPSGQKKMPCWERARKLEGDDQAGSKSKPSSSSLRVRAARLRWPTSSPTSPRPSAPPRAPRWLPYRSPGFRVSSSRYRSCDVQRLVLDWGEQVGLATGAAVEEQGVGIRGATRL
jgi:hypothetical protein